MLLESGASTGRSIEEYKKRRFDRAIERLDAQDDGKWITTENGHHVHLNEAGEPDMGNDKVIEAMKGKAPHKVVQGKNITKTWKRRPDQYEHEIEDVIAAQGFDGHPRLVDDDEFEAAVKAANGGKGFVAMRTYTAPSKEVADEYRRMLYDGKWYVDCSTGGAQYGQGMYCAADYTGKESKAMRDEIGHYIGIGKSRARKDRAELLREEEAKAYEDEGYEEAYYLLASKDDKKVLDDWIKLYEASKKPSPDFKELDEFLAKYPDYSKVGEYESVKAAADKYKEFSKKADECRKKPISEISRYYLEAMKLDPLTVSNTEFITLDPSAKIIKYDDAVRLYKQNIEQATEDAKEGAFDSTLDEMGVNDPKKRREYKEIYPAFIRQGTRFGRDKAIENYEKLREQYGLADEEVDNFSKKVKLKLEKVEYKAMQMDVGSVCALYGYDAINAEGHGRTQSYTVILNRTKCIIKRPKDWKTDGFDRFRLRRQARLDAKKGKIEFKYNKEGIVEAWRDGKLLGAIGTLGDVVKKSDAERFRERRQKRLDAKEDEGRWITTENGHHVHLNEEGDPDKGNPKVVAYMEDSELGSKKKLNDEFARIALSGKNEHDRSSEAWELLDRMREGTRITFPESWRDDRGRIPYVVKGVSKETGAVEWLNPDGSIFDSNELSYYMLDKNEEERPKVTRAARTEESLAKSREKKEGNKDPQAHKHDGTVIGNHASDFRNEYASPADRQYIKRAVERIRPSVDDERSVTRAGKAIEEEIASRANLRRTREQGCDGKPQVEDIYDTLRDIRPFGLPEGSELMKVDSSEIDPERTAAIIKEATDRFPTQWFEDIDKPVHIIIHDDWGRAYYAEDQWGEGHGGYIHIFTKHDPKVIEGLDVDDNISDVGIANTLAHELGHYVEANNSYIRYIAGKHLEDRTKDSPETDLEPGYTTKADSFFSSYMGKQYKGRNTTEITSVLVQNLGSVDPFDVMQGMSFFQRQKTDKKSLRFALAMLGGM